MLFSNTIYIPIYERYDVKFSNGLDCGGAYIKLIQNIPKFDPEDLTDKTPYVIMFGPDKCGGTDKVCLMLYKEI